MMVRLMTGFAAAFALLGAAAAQDAHPPYAVERTEVRTLVSKTGAAYRIYVAMPDAPAPTEGYPALYVLDGDDFFAIAAKTAERFQRFSQSSGVGPGIVIAIGYPGETRRSFDFTPAAGETIDRYGNPVGGAEAFRAFIRDVLRPAIEAEFDVDPERQALMGHSYGGLFVLDAFFSEPGLFNAYIASSPSIWYGDRILLEKEKPLADKLGAAGPRTLVLTVGDREQEGPRGAVSRMVDDNRAMAGRLGALDNLTLHHRVLVGEDHGSSALPAIAEAVAVAFSNREPQP